MDSRITVVVLLPWVRTRHVRTRVGSICFLSIDVIILIASASFHPSLVTHYAACLAKFEQITRKDSSLFLTTCGMELIDNSLPKRVSLSFHYFLGFCWCPFIMITWGLWHNARYCGLSYRSVLAGSFVRTQCLGRRRTRPAVILILQRLAVLGCLLFPRSSRREGGRVRSW